MGMNKSYEEAKAQLQNISKYRLEQEKAVDDKIKEYKGDLDTQLLKEYTRAQVEAGVAAEKKIADVKEQSLKKAAQKQQKIKDKYAKEEAKLTEKQEKAKTETEKQRIEDEKKALKEKQDTELKNITEKAQKELDNAEKIAKRKEALENLSKQGKVGQAASDILSGNLSAISSAIGDFVSGLKNDINSIASYKSSIDTRLQGSKQSKSEGSYWQQISKDITNSLALSPLVKQSDVASKIQTMVNKGISYNVEQRAFLATISDKIATTFESTNGSLARLIRIQQQDSTAARLGMESALNTFLNNMYETTEYMEDVMSNIRGNLEEAEALMSTEASTEFDYQVNKWLGSLYSVGVSSSTVQSISNALGDLAAGKISGITSDGAGNLIVMAANNAGLSVADLLQEGLDASSTNKLMSAMVEYLKGIYTDTSGSLVLQQQYADVFGMTASDLKALSNLSSADIANTSKQNLTYSGMLSQLNSMANSMYSRTSLGEMIGNLSSNFKYTMANGIASNVGLYSTFMLADMLDSFANGVEFSLPMVAGTGTAQTFKVSDIMKTGTLVGSIISGMSGIISSLGSGLDGSALLRSFNINSNNYVSRGNGSGLITTSGAAVSSSGYVGNASSGDVYEKSMTDVQDSTKSQVAEAVEENNEATTTDINNNISLIYQLLQDVTTGTLSLRVDPGDTTIWSQTMSAIY